MPSSGAAVRGRSPWRPVVLAFALAGVAGAAPWPGEWQVMRVEMGLPPGSPGAAACMLTTSDHVARPFDPTRWALRYRRGELVVIENSMGVGDATIPTLALAIDGRGFGVFAIRERVAAPEHTPSVVKYVSAIAAVPDETVREAVVAALRAGSVVRIERRGRAFEKVLDEAAAAAFATCRRELER